MTAFARFGQVGRNRWLCDTVSCENEASWERPGARGVTLLYCTPCKRKAEEASD